MATTKGQHRRQEEGEIGKDKRQDSKIRQCGHESISVHLKKSDVSPSWCETLLLPIMLCVERLLHECMDT